MKTALIVLLLLSLFPYAFAWISGYYRRQQLGTIDNKNPRQQYTQLSGPGARAVAAQQNAWEALGFYSAALLAVSLTDVEIEHLSLAAILVLLFRVLHGIFYLANLDLLRSLSFVAGMLPSVYLFYGAITNS
ncbi:MAG TPA: MAPEG family protein [Cellvibrio sp.]|nr:MAPEG family protein [Cellvibrio sp.]